MTRAIVHLDADAFFASVEQAADPRLRGKPVAVGGEKRGVIASASYEARRLGVSAPMPTARARQLCPKLIVLPGDFEKYERFSQWMFSYAYDFTPAVEVASIDEGYFDLSGAGRPAVEIAQTIRDAIHQALKISVSEGIGSNKLVSQIGSKLHKPAGLVRVLPGQEIPFLHPLPNFWLPGVGPQTSDRLKAAGLARIGQVAATPLELLSLLVGRAAPTLRNFANGIDDRLIVPEHAPAKSYSQQETFAEDTTDLTLLEAVLCRMADRLMAAVRAEHKSIRTLTVKVRYNDMAEDQCGESLAEPTDLETDLYPRLRVLLGRAWKRRVSLRMVSLKLTNLYEAWMPWELPLEAPAQRQAARRRLADAIDRLRQTCGNRAVLRGHDLVWPRPEAAGAPGRPGREPAGGHSALQNFKPQLVKAGIPLAAHSYYSFLDSTLSPAALVALASRYELPALALTDRGNLHGAVEFVQAAQTAGLRPILGVELRLEGRPLRLYVENRAGYQRLCRWLSQLSGPLASEDDEPAAPAGLSAQRRMTEATRLGTLLRQESTEGLLAVGADPRWAEWFPGRFYLGAANAGEGRQWAAHSTLPQAACWPVHYDTPAAREKFDIVQSIRTRTLLRQAHPEKVLESDFHFLTPAEVQTRFRDFPGPLAGGAELAARCTFEFPFGPPQFPAFIPPDGSAPIEFLRRLTQAGLRQRYPAGGQDLETKIAEELSIIQAVGYAEYFLVVWDLLQACRRQGITWLTRGSAADSLVCYCLGISDVCPIRFDLYFRRFLNLDRMRHHKLPDIDLDFPHDRKDDVVDLVFAKYGTAHTAIVGGFSTYQARSAVGDVAKVLGVSEFQIRRLTERLPHVRPEALAEAVSLRQECRDLPLAEEPYRTAIALARDLDGFPRHPKMHPCGIVLSRVPLSDLSPCFISNKGYPTTHFDMDAVEALGLVKLDLLAQGGLAVMRDVQRSLAARGVTADPSRLEPWEDGRVWGMIAGGGARAVHHIESPAMIGLCRRCQVRDIDGLIALVSVIRPGAANENKKSEFVQRYLGLAPVVYPHPSLAACLRSTFGLVVYEEHILQIGERFAGWSLGRADELRRKLGKLHGAAAGPNSGAGVPGLEEFQRDFFTGARAQGHDAAAIERVWGLVSGFQGYAFCKAHSTAYGVEAYQSAWLKCYYPVDFMAAVLTNGKGFYPALVYVLECHRLGITLWPPWVNDPGPDFGVRVAAGGALAIRVPATRVKGLSQRTRDRLLAEHTRGAFQSLADFYTRVGPDPAELEALIRAGALDGFGQPRTAQFWETQILVRASGAAASPGQGWLWPPDGAARIPPTRLDEPSRRQRLQWEAELLGFPVSGHPLELYAEVAWDTYCPVTDLGRHPWETVVVCGLVIEQRIHHQVTGEPMKFLTLADWTGMVETDLFAETYRSYGLATVRYPVLEVTAIVEPYERGDGFSLRVLRAGKPRRRAR